jgi:hypothetical protein
MVVAELSVESHEEVRFMLKTQKSLAVEKGAEEVTALRQQRFWWFPGGRGMRILLVVALLLIAGSSPLVGNNCWGVPNPADLQREQKRLENGRIPDALNKAAELGGELNLSDLEKLPANFMGQTNPGAAIVNAVSDTAKEATNFLQCMDFKILPGCWCGKKTALGVPIPVFPAYEYRYPMNRYEITRQPFQSDYFPSLFMKLLQNDPRLDLSVPLLVKLDFSTVVLSLLKQGFKVPKPSVALDFIKNLVNMAFYKVPNAKDNKARGGGLQGDGTTQTSVHAMPSPFRYSPLSDPFAIVAVKSHFKDGFESMPLPAFTEHPMLGTFARSPGRSAYISKEKKLVDMWMRMLTDPRACARFNMKQWIDHFKEDGPTVGMVPGLINAGSGDVEADKHPCLRFGNIKWFPFDFQLNVSSEPMAAWVSALKMAKLLSQTRGAQKDGTRVWSDLYDLKDDKFHYLRGQGLGGLRCANIEMAHEEFGDANELERPAQPIMITHWKRYSGCPRGFELLFSCPYEKIARQSKFNPEVKNSTRTP